MSRLRWPNSRHSLSDVPGTVHSAEDCALVFDVIHGPDGKDNTLLDVPFNWDATAEVSKLRVGYLRTAFVGEILVNPENRESVAR